jgi:putative transposase
MIQDAAKEHGVSEVTIYTWRKKFGTIDVPDTKRLRALESENGRLKKVLAESQLENSVLKDVAEKNGRRAHSKDAGSVRAQASDPTPPLATWRRRSIYVAGIRRPKTTAKFLSAECPLRRGRSRPKTTAKFLSAECPLRRGRSPSLAPQSGAGHLSIGCVSTAPARPEPRHLTAHIFTLICFYAFFVGHPRCLVS